MSARDDGGSAFPRDAGYDFQGSRVVSASPGVSVRDYFAAAALQGMLAQPITGAFEDYASDAYAAADAMLAERAK